MATCSENVNHKKKSENGNVLFLILIAVALFAALSYAVTQSSQVGAGKTDNESGKIHASQLNQYPTLVRSQILRMRARNIEMLDLEFNPPSAFGSLSSPDVGVFHPSGGTTYITAAPALMENEMQGQWAYNVGFEINNLGTSETSNVRGNELITFLPGIKENICRRVNELSGVNTTPSINNATYYNQALEFMDDSYAQPTGETIIGDANLTALSAQPFGCFLESSSGQHIYYFVLIER